MGFMNRNIVKSTSRTIIWLVSRLIESNGGTLYIYI